MSTNLREPAGFVSILREKDEMIKANGDILAEGVVNCTSELHYAHQDGVAHGYRIALRDVIELWSNIDYSDEERVKKFLTNEIFIDWDDY